MNPSKDSVLTTKLEGEAREWLIRLDGDAPLSAAEKLALRAWMARAPAHAAELKRLSAFWNGANLLTELAVPLQGLGTASRSRQARFWWAAAAACLCGVLGVGLWLFSPGHVVNGTYATALGQQQTLVLEDGSGVRMNTDSQVQIEYGDRLRKVRLFRGEAFFTVASNKGRPFEVFAAGGVVRAVGTAFAVAVQGSDIRITVARGQVDVSDAAQAEEPAASQSTGLAFAVQRTHLALKAGETVTVGGSVTARPESLPSDELKRRLSWQSGFLVFTGQPLRDVVSEVNRYSPVTLEIADPKLANLAVGGRFKVGDLDAICDALHSSLGIQVVRVDDQHLQLRPSQAR